MLVGIGNVLGVGRPGGAVEEARLGAQVDDRRRLESGLVVQIKLVLAGGVREVGDGLAIRAPGGVALGHAGGLGEVAGVALFGRDGEDFAMRLKNGARAGGREAGVLDLVRGEVDPVGRQGGQLAVDLDRDGMFMLGRRVQQMNGAELLHKTPMPHRPGLEGLQIEPVVRHHLR